MPHDIEDVWDEVAVRAIPATGNTITPLSAEQRVIGSIWSWNRYAYSYVAFPVHDMRITPSTTEKSVKNYPKSIKWVVTHRRFIKLLALRWPSTAQQSNNWQMITEILTIRSTMCGWVLWAYCKTNADEIVKRLLYIIVI